MSQNNEFPGAIQLLCHDGDGFKVHENAFQNVLNADQDLLQRKLVVISIAGEYRKGKSFFLNYVMRYLRNQGQGDWMQVNQTLEGFVWRGGNHRVTNGIAMWPEIFPLGKEYAVILLDTEGTYDEQSTNKSMSHVFAASTLISSLQIFNVNGRISKHTMHEIQFFSEFGKLASTSPENRPFQTLLILVRDWIYDDEISHGVEGGRAELEKWLKEDHDGVRETLESCFSKLECYLMPHPGAKVANDPEFKGNIPAGKFRDHLQQVIENIFSQEYLQPKKVGNQGLVVKDFPEIFSMFASSLQNSKFDIKSMFESQVEDCNMKAKHEAIAKFKNQMEEQINCHISVSEFSKLKTEARDAAMKLFDGTLKVGGKQAAQKYRNALEQDLFNEESNYEKKYDNEQEHKIKVEAKDMEIQKLQSSLVIQSTSNATPYAATLQQTEDTLPYETKEILQCAVLVQHVDQEIEDLKKTYEQNCRIEHEKCNTEIEKVHKQDFSYSSDSAREKAIKIESFELSRDTTLFKMLKEFNENMSILSKIKEELIKNENMQNKHSVLKLICNGAETFSRTLKSKIVNLILTRRN